MSPLRTSIAALSLALVCAASARAQAQPAQQPERLPVTATATNDRVRFSAPNRVARLRLEVLSASGEPIFEANSRGSVLDWTLSDAQGNRLADGQYLCVLTVKDAAGTLTQRLTLIEVAGAAVAARAAAASDLTPRQSDAVGPVEGEAAGVVIGGAADAPAATVLAHDGKDGQVVTTAGDLSFRGGDFFTGRDRELMRLSADGSLTVEGSLTARGGIRFSDGTVLQSARGIGARAGGKGAKSGGAADAARVDGDGSASPSATQNRLAKFDAGGSLVDSNVTEDSVGNIGVGSSPAPSVRLNISSPFGTVPFAFTQNAPESAFPTLALFSTGDGTLGQYAATTHNGAGTFLMGGTAGKNFGVFSNNAYNAPQFFISAAGNVGVGTTNPQARLDVAGGLKVSGDAVIDGNIAAKYQDLAEWVPGRGNLPAGTVVVLDRSRTNGVVASRRAYSTHVAGVVSAQPGVILGEGGPGQVMVATTGRVRVKVDATKSPIRVGDLLVASNAEGVAMRSVPVRAGRNRLHRPGTIIGKALEPLSSGTGEILVLLSLQ